MRLALFTAFAFLVVISGAMGLTTTSMPWKDGEPLADGWTMSQPTLPQTYKFPLTLGVGTTEGMSGDHALFMTAEQGVANRFLEQRIDLAAWRGKRLRVSLRLKPQDKTLGNVAFTVTNSDGSKVMPKPGEMRNARKPNVWSTEQFVLDVPAKAEQLLVRVTKYWSGTLWIDQLVLEGVGHEVNTDAVRVVPAMGGTDTSPPAPAPLGPNAVALGEGWKPTNVDRKSVV